VTISEEHLAELRQELDNLRRFEDTMYYRFFIALVLAAPDECLVFSKVDLLNTLSYELKVGRLGDEDAYVLTVEPKQ
jgi:hypothetical protein